MNCSQAIKIILSNFKNNYIGIFTTGFISRRAFAIRDRQENFYMLGSMGLASALGIGMALNSDNKIVIFDGDGSALMDLGTIAMIGQQGLNNLIHIVLDNEVYESTGNQPSIAKEVDISCIAKSAGYKRIYRFRDEKELKRQVKSILEDKGPVFILIKLNSKDKNIPPRVFLSPEEITARIKKTAFY